MESRLSSIKSPLSVSSLHASTVAQSMPVCILSHRFSSTEEIDFSNTFYSFGPIRGEAFEGLTNLNYVDIADNTYTTTIPTQFVDLPNLEFFYLDNCDFPGVDLTLDFIIGMPSIFENWMDFTQFTGSIPTEIGTVSTLGSWSLTFCGLSGPIPSELGNLGVTLDRLWLYQNQLTGTIPTEIGNLSRMQFMYFEGNQLSGDVPAEICANRSPLALLTVSTCRNFQFHCVPLAWKQLTLSLIACTGTWIRLRPRQPIHG